MAVSDKDRKAPSARNGSTQGLIDMISDSGLFQPLANMLNRLLDDPLLRQTLDQAPADYSPPKKSPKESPKESRESGSPTQH